MAVVQNVTDPRNSKKARWYFGGVASAGAACCTHPLDLIKVQLQTQQTGKVSISSLVMKILRTQGVVALYSGISASILRQMTYSTTRFGIYEVVKQAADKKSGGKPLSFATLVGIAGVAGAAGGLVGTPADMVNVRMQNDVKLAPELRRNYKNVVDGLIKVYRFEGAKGLFSGASSATSRAILMTVGQLAFYDVVKAQLIKMDFKDNSSTHFLASLAAGGIATSLTQPLDVIKTRAMNAKPGEFSGIISIISNIFKHSGPFGFYKGFVPAFVRLGPHTILTFLFLEQLRLGFGFYPKKVEPIQL